MTKPSDLPAPCPACGAKSFDPGRFFTLFGLCAYCFVDADERAAARIRIRSANPQPIRFPPMPTSHPPGSEGRVEIMAWRLDHGYALVHPDDATAEDADGTQVQEAPDPVHPDDLTNGVEMDRSKGQLCWRARPRWRDCRVNLGRFKDYRKAADAVKGYYVARWGSWDDSRPWLRLTAAAAVVRLKRGTWYDVEFPDGVCKSMARRAAQSIHGRHFATRGNAVAAFDRELNKLGTLTCEA